MGPLKEISVQTQGLFCLSLILMQVIVISGVGSFDPQVPPNLRLPTFIDSFILTEENFVVWPNGDKLYILQPNISIEINSPIYLVQLAHHEKGLYEMLRDYYLKELVVGGLRDSGSGAPASNRWILPILEAYIKDYEESVIVTKVEFNMNWINAQHLVSQHPLLVFRMIFRFVVYLHKIPNYVLQSWKFGTAVKLAEEEPDYKKTWPTMVEYEAVVLAFLRIQHTYNMDAEDLVSGNVMGKQIPIRLSLEQSLDIGTHASKNTMHTLAIQWFEIARKLVEQKKSRYSALTYESLKENVVLLLEHEISQHDNYTLKGLNITKWGHYHFQTPLLNNGTLLRPNERTSLRDISSEKNGTFIHDDFDLYKYWNLCSGKKYQNEKEVASLYCYYEGSVHPTFLIGPLKIEFLTKSPEIIQIYDIIGPKVVESMVSVTWNKVQRSRVVNRTHPGKSEKSNHRTSVEGWIWEPDSILTNLARKIEAMTGNNVLKPKSSEVYLVAGYSFGGHYECHLDAFKNPGEFRDLGNRIATMMFYLNEPEKGGNTAFPNLGIFVRPVQYSGVFWYNLLPSGSRDLRTYHCACPVILGHKWISTKWIRHYEQFLKKKCDLELDPDASFTFAPNKNN